MSSALSHNYRANSVQQTSAPTIVIPNPHARSLLNRALVSSDADAAAMQSAPIVESGETSTRCPPTFIDVAIANGATPPICADSPGAIGRNAKPNGRSDFLQQIDANPEFVVEVLGNVADLGRQLLSNHLFGISLMLFALGYIFILSEVNVWFKRFLVLSPMVAVFVDILSWFLTKWDPVYAYTIVIAGALLGFSMAMQIVISLYQLWFLKRPESK